MRVIAMFRVSTETQANNGASLDAQVRIYHELATKSRWRTVGEFRGCESATQAATDRRVLRQVLEAVHEHKPDAIYVHEQSRLTRGDELEVALLMRELREQKVKIIVGGVVRDLASIDERFMIGIQSLVDRAESERIKERISRGKREKARQGKRSTGAAPFGYRNPHPGQPGRGTLVVVPEEAAVVRRAFELVADGHGFKAAARKLNAEGFRASRGGTWGRSSLCRTVFNPVYIGVSAANIWVRVANRPRQFVMDLKNPKAIIVENAHESIVSRELWDRVQMRPRLARSGSPTMLTGLLWINGSRAGGDTNHGRPFYRESRRKANVPWLERPYTEETVWSAFTSIATDPQILKELLWQEGSQSTDQSSEEDQTRLEATIAKHRKRLATLLDMRSDGEIDKDQYFERCSESRQILEDAQRELAALGARKNRRDPRRFEAAVGIARTLLGSSKRLTEEQRRSILRSVVHRVDVSANRREYIATRGPTGTFTSGPRDHIWKISKVTISLAVPPNDDWKSQKNSSTSRDRHLDTTC